jgi:hypothetical protein
MLTKGVDKCRGGYRGQVASDLVIYIDTLLAGNNF